MRQIVLDTETTGLKPGDGHRIIEIGCLELINRRITGNKFHCYINPGREIDLGAQQVHGITRDFLRDKPFFHEIVESFLDFVQNDELVIHNAPFDVGFINAELQQLESMNKTAHLIEQKCKVLDTLTMARKLFPGQKNSLDALCKRFQVNNSHREWHGALLDAELLAKVYLAMTGGQVSLFEEKIEHAQDSTGPKKRHSNRPADALKIVKANPNELENHQNYLLDLEKKAEKHYWNYVDET